MFFESQLFICLDALKHQKGILIMNEWVFGIKEQNFSPFPEIWIFFIVSMQDWVSVSFWE